MPAWGEDQALPEDPWARPDLTLCPPVAADERELEPITWAQLLTSEVLERIQEMIEAEDHQVPPGQALTRPEACP